MVESQESFGANRGDPTLSGGNIVEIAGAKMVRHCAWCIPGPSVVNLYPGYEVTSGICPDHFGEQQRLLNELLKK